MPYIEEAPSQAWSLQFLPARAAGVALALGSLASFVALVFLVQLALSLPSNEGGDVVLTAFTACGYLFFTVTGLVCAYARFLPPSTTRIWDLVRAIISYLSLLWIVCFALSASLLGGTLMPYLEWCAETTFNATLSETEPEVKPRSDVLASANCSTAKSLSMRILSACAVALASTLALCTLVSLDLHATQHQARVVVQRTQLVAKRRLVQIRRQREMQQAAVMSQPLLGLPPEFSSSDEEAQLGYGPSSPLFRSRGLPPSNPFLQAQAAPAPPSLPNPMLSPGKRRPSEHQHQHREDLDSSEPGTRRWKGDDGDYRPQRRHNRYEGDKELESRGSRQNPQSFERDDRLDDDGTDSTSSTSSSSSSTTSHTTDDEARRGRHRRPHRHQHHGREANARRKHKQKRKAKKAAASANVGTAQSVGGLDAGVVDM
ncbi:uncharacterized protein JCM10292_004352 [Rhodotorula paludigena]|uniref:uncharacterized protein n=1 Tax=Rhodotorula paludigena TaxID=86838 RepID=UPI003171C0A6